MTIRNAAILSLAMACATTAATAQVKYKDMIGSWQCEQGIAPLKNTKLPSVYISFSMLLEANGDVRAEGIANQINQFRAEGRWRLGDGGVFSAQGQMSDALGVQPWGFSSRATSTRTMNERSADQNNSYATQCQKR